MDSQSLVRELSARAEAGDTAARDELQRLLKMSMIVSRNSAGELGVKDWGGDFPRFSRQGKLGISNLGGDLGTRIVNN